MAKSRRSCENVNPRTLGFLTAAATTYEFVTPSTEAGAGRAIVLIAVGGVSAEALLAPKSDAMNAHRKQRTPK